MQNLTLRQGDLVRALRSVFGLVKGQVYLVESSGLGQGLRLSQGLTVPIDLVHHDGALSYLADAVSIVQCPVVLSRGANWLA